MFKFKKKIAFTYINYKTLAKLWRIKFNKLTLCHTKLIFDFHLQ